MKSFQQEYTIKAPLEKVWQAFVDPEIIEKWSGSKAKMDDQEGSDFELWNNDIYGKNIQVIQEKKLVQDWYGGDWSEPSKVTFNFSESNGETKVALLHENLPDDEADDFKQGWKDYYLEPIKKLLED